MNLHTFYTDCLSYEQLEAYASDKSGKSERATLYKHISACELCACAVNGFAASPFTSDELVAIHREIDVKTNATQTSPLTFARVSIVLISLAVIALVYNLSNRSSQSPAVVKMPPVEKPLILNIAPDETPTELQKEISLAAATYKKIIHVISEKKYQRNITPVEELEPIRPDEVLLSEAIASVQKAEPLVPFRFNADVIYIYDLKVSDYNNLYFMNPAAEMLKHTPSPKENKEADQMEKDEQESIPANRILKKGLEYFNRGKYRKASLEFRQLIEVNSQDVNALFYNAVASYQLGKYDVAISNLRDVLANKNNVFHPEAKWNLALVHLRTGERAQAKQLLTEIVSEKGFYAKKAADKLKGLQ